MRRNSILAMFALSAAVSALGADAAGAVLQRGTRHGLDLAPPWGPLAIGSLAEATRGDSLEARARDFLARRGGSLGITGLAGAELELRAVRQGKAVDVVRFRQTVGGVPVHEGELVVGFDRDGRVIHVANALRPIAGAPAAAATLSAAKARTRAFDLLGVEKAPLWERSELVVFAAADGARLAWRIDALLDGAAGGGEWRTFVDATTGEIFRYEDASYYDSGTGQAFLPNPLATAGVLYGTPGYVDGSDADTPELVAELGTVTLLDITFAGGNYSLVGPYAECLEFSAPVGTCPAQPSSDFSWNSRSDDRFEAVNVYFHIDAWMRYANATLGVPVDPYQYAGGVQFDPRALNGADNSSYNSGTGRLSFGEGGVDDAEDPDVVIHELGHGIHDWMTGGFLSQQEGLSEGVGDYFAVSWMRSFGVWTPSDPQYNWVFAWDGHNPFWGGRVTTWNDTHQYPGDLVGQEHTDGQFWSSCNMDVWESLGREATDTAMLEGLSMTSSQTNQSAAAQAVLDAAVALNYSVPELESIATIYDDCGYDVSLPWELPFLDGFEAGDTSEWSATQN